MGPTVARDAEPRPRAQHNLPAALTSVIGRERELRELAEALRRARIVTLAGPGGVGKTTLALELARRQASARRDGVRLVDLTAGGSGADVAAETARAFELSTGGARSAIDVLREFLAARDVLLVLDNCEHVVEACAGLVEALAAACPDVRVLATSREVLHVSGEHVVTLDPLAPDDARRLFVERARQRRPGFIPAAGDDEAIARLCERLDRLPLAIELAAGRVGAMSPGEILSGLESRLGSLGGGRRLAPARHRTVRAAIAWSHQLLDVAEQEALRSLAVFVGGFDAEAAAAVAPGLSGDMLAGLVDKSLVSVAEGSGGRTRYRLLETVRAYEHELLLERGELDAARDRHLRHFSAFGVTQRDGWPAIGALRVVTTLRDDYENVRAALEWAAASDACAGMALYAGTWDLFFVFGQSDGLRLGELLLAGCPARNRLRVLLQISVGGLRMLQSDMEGVRAIQDDARALAAELGEPALEGWALLFRGLASTLAGAASEGREALTAARDLHRELGVPNGEGRAIAALGLMEMIGGDTGRAKALVEQALAMQIAAGDAWPLGQCHTYLGMIAEASGDRRSAAAHYRQAVDALRPFSDAAMLPAALALQAGLLGRDARRALMVVAAAYAIRARAGGEFAPVFLTRIERIRADAEAALGAEAAAVWARGQRLDPDEAIGLAFGRATPQTELPGGLSERELEVVRLLADGLTNKAIASRLHLSVRTVESHVRHVLAKAGLENRTQLAAWVRERIR